MGWSWGGVGRVFGVVVSAGFMGCFGFSGFVEKWWFRDCWFRVGLGLVQA